MKFKSTNVEETFAIAKDLADKCIGNEIIILNGELGAGKTTFTKGFAKALGIEKIVTSPTFTLVKTYTGGRLTLYHFDLYRLDSVSEEMELGFDEYFDNGGICIIEWNKIKNLKGKIIVINFTDLGDGVREIIIEEKQCL